MNCSGELSHKKRTICQAIATERALSIIDSDRNQLPYALPGYSYQISPYNNLLQSQWKYHHSWPSQTLLLYDHRRFRGISQDIVSGIYEIHEEYLQTQTILNSRSLKGRIVKSLQDYQEELTIHARYSNISPYLSPSCLLTDDSTLLYSTHPALRCEEARLFPLMSERYWHDNELENLTSQHELLDQKIRSLNELLQELSENSDGEDLRLLLITAIEADDILLHHLGIPPTLPSLPVLIFSPHLCSL